LRKRARAFVENERNWRVSVARYRVVYESLLDARDERAFGAASS
jgi:hypothetical protein